MLSADAVPFIKKLAGLLNYNFKPAIVFEFYDPSSGREYVCDWMSREPFSEWLRSLDFYCSRTSITRSFFIVCLVCFKKVAGRQAAAVVSLFKVCNDFNMHKT